MRLCSVKLPTQKIRINLELNTNKQQLKKEGEKGTKRKIGIAILLCYISATMKQNVIKSARQSKFLSHDFESGVLQKKDKIISVASNTTDVKPLAKAVKSSDSVALLFAKLTDVQGRDRNTWKLAREGWIFIFQYNKTKSKQKQYCM